MRSRTVSGVTRSPSWKRTSVDDALDLGRHLHHVLRLERAERLDLVDDVLDGDGGHAHAQGGRCGRAAAAPPRAPPQADGEAPTARARTRGRHSWVTRILADETGACPLERRLARRETVT